MRVGKKRKREISSLSIPTFPDRREDGGRAMRQSIDAGAKKRGKGENSHVHSIRKEIRIRVGFLIGTSTTKAREREGKKEEKGSVSSWLLSFCRGEGGGPGSGLILRCGMLYRRLRGEGGREEELDDTTSARRCRGEGCKKGKRTCIGLCFISLCSRQIVDGRKEGGGEEGKVSSRCPWMI